MNKTTKTFNSIIYGLSFMFLVLTLSISVPILWRGFYTIHVDLLDIPNLCNHTREEILFSFNELMDCLVLYKEPFSEGVFPFSESGMNHFLDCRILFTLDLVVLAISGLIFIPYFILIKTHKIEVYRPFGFSMLFYFSFIPIVLLGALGTYALIDVDAAFALFHTILFPGKENWIFNGRTDPIIYAMPEQYFLDCGILIFGLLLIILLGTIIYQIIKKIKYNGNIKYYCVNYKNKI